MRIILDLDEVLCAFVEGVRKVWGVSEEDLNFHWPKGVYGMTAPLSHALGLGEVMTEESFWKLINGRAEFWGELEPLPWAAELVDLVAGLTDDWHVVSAPSRCESCHVGKVRWLRAFFGPDFDRFALTPHKHLFASPDAVLIDDKADNCGAFVDGGGFAAVLFPRRHNSLHDYAHDPMRHVRRELGYYSHKFARLKGRGEGNERAAGKA